MLDVGCSQAFLLCALLLALMIAAPNLDAAETNSLNAILPPAATAEPVPRNARAAYNAGTRRLREGRLREAEALLTGALSRQDDAVQPPALYNLGHVRFRQGAEELKKSPGARRSAAVGRAATQRARQAAALASDALAGNDVQSLLEAYVRGRGAKRDLNAAAKAVRRALELHGSALREWRRSLADFQGAAELNPADTNATHNAEIVEQAIARLVDDVREMQQAAMAMAAAGQELGDLLKQLKGRIPDGLLPGGEGGEGDEGEEGEEGEDGKSPGGLLSELVDAHEGPSREGTELPLSPEEVGWLLDSYLPDSTRRLPMGQGQQAPARERNRRNW